MAEEASVKWMWVVLGVVAAAAVFPRLHAPSFFDPNESRYAEVAREMVLTGDWITPHFNFYPFLNKPPLLYWLTALSFLSLGTHEGVARLIPAMAAWGTIMVTFFLGRIVYTPLTGFLAGLILLTSPGFYVDGRQLKPDMLLTFFISVSFLLLIKIFHSSQRRTVLHILLSAALALAVLTKGLVGIAIPLLALALWLMRKGELKEAHHVVSLSGLLVFFLVAAPWHLLAGTHNPGFLWHYFVNEHVFRFLDVKYPRDLRPHSLMFFWGIFLLRFFPWCLFLPLAVVRTARDKGLPSLPLLWACAVLGFFSLTPARHDHYALPAIPATALMTAHLWKAYLTENRNSSSLTWPMRFSSGAFVAIGLVSPFLGPHILATMKELSKVPELFAFASFFLGTLSVCAGVVFMTILWKRWAVYAACCLAAGWILFGAFRALILVEPLFSSKPLAEVILRMASPGDKIVFEAPVEYQSCSGLLFYTRREIEILQPSHFVPPPYLVAHKDIFLDRRQWVKEWRGESRVFLVTNPLLRRATVEGVVPSPYRVLGKWGNSWLVANRL